jgi:hypothetical protein
MTVEQWVKRHRPLFNSALTKGPNITRRKVFLTFDH